MWWRVDERFPTVSTSDLSRRPREVLDRVASGERLIVCHRKKPVATLQPLDGYVFQPFDGTVQDVFGWPVGGLADEVDKLSDVERALLVDGYKDWRIRPVRLGERFPRPAVLACLEDMAVRGLVFRGERGWEPTGRGLALREELLRRGGRGDQGQDQTLPGSLRDSNTVWT